MTGEGGIHFYKELTSISECTLWRNTACVSEMWSLTAHTRLVSVVSLREYWRWISVTADSIGQTNISWSKWLQRVWDMQVMPNVFSHMICDFTALWGTRGETSVLPALVGQYSEILYNCVCIKETIKPDTSKPGILSTLKSVTFSQAEDSENSCKILIQELLLI